MEQTITISLPTSLTEQLDTLCKETGLTREEIIEQSLNDILFLRQFDTLCENLTAHLRAQGIETEAQLEKRLSS